MNICSILFFRPHRRSGILTSPSLAHYELVHVSDSMFCKEKSMSLWDFAIFLPVILVYKFHPFKIFDVPAWKCWFINSTSSEFYNIYAFNFSFISSTSSVFFTILGVMQHMLGRLKMNRITSISHESRISALKVDKWLVKMLIMYDSQHLNPAGI